MLKVTAMDPASLEQMKQRAEELLEKRGVTIDHPELCAALAEKGCSVDGAQVRFPRALIAQATAAVPARFTLYSPSGEHDLPFPHPQGGFYTRTNTGAPNYRTPDGDVHSFRLEEAEAWFTLANSLSNIDFVALPSVAGAKDVPLEAVDLYALERALQISQKHIWIQPYETASVQGLIDMAAAASGGADKLREKPIVSFIACSVPLLSFKHMDAEILLRCAEAGIPVQPCSLPTAGANTPVTAQGTALVCCAEVLAMIVMLELLCPGLPVIATPLPFSMDMMTTYTLQSAPETALCRLLCMQFFEDGYGIRAHTYATGTDSLTLDGQSLIERTSLAHMLALSGGSVLGGAGQIETAKTNCPLTLIADDEIFGIAQRLRRGLVVDDETMDVEELFGDPEKLEDGFIMTGHTLRHYKEITRPPLFSRVGVNTWKENGCLTFEDRVRARYEELTQAPVRHALDADTTAALETAFRKAVADVCGK
ncbi:MAG: trimethylamine methyltransferase family protein [Butyricicoccus sp.]|nr:trimethylamine methyltransferase family protein [Butyricicoccus sp.]